MEHKNVNHFDYENNISLQFGHRGKVAIFIDGNNLFHAARFHNIDIDYNKLLRVLLGDGRLFRAFFYTGVYAVNSVAYKGCRVEVAGFRSNTAPKLIDVADCFIDLGEIAERVRKDFAHGMRYEERDIHVSQQPPPPASFIEPAPLVPPCADSP